MKTNKLILSDTIRNSENMFRISGSGAEKAQNYAPKIDGWRLWPYVGLEIAVGGGSQHLRLGGLKPYYYIIKLHG